MILPSGFALGLASSPKVAVGEECPALIIAEDGELISGFPRRTQFWVWIGDKTQCSQVSPHRKAGLSPQLSWAPECDGIWTWTRSIGSSLLLMDKGPSVWHWAVVPVASCHPAQAAVWTRPACGAWSVCSPRQAWKAWVRPGSSILRPQCQAHITGCGRKGSLWIVMGFPANYILSASSG